MSTFIPGYLASLSIDAVALEQVTAQGGISLRKNIMLKPVAGVVAPVAIAGIRTGELTLSGHCTVEDVTLLNTAYDSDTPVAYDFQIGALLGDDAGSYTGDCLISEFNPEYDAEGQWSFTMDAVLSGDATFVEPA